MSRSFGVSAGCYRTYAPRLAEAHPTVVLIDAGYRDDLSLEMISDVLMLSPAAQVILLTEDPPGAQDVARAIHAGALGFVDVGAAPADIAGAVRSVHLGERWLPPQETKEILGSVVGEFLVTSAERRSGVIAAVGSTQLQVIDIVDCDSSTGEQ